MNKSDKTFQFWPGSLELENKPTHLLIAKQIEERLASCHGYLAYHLTNLGRADEDEVPSFILVTREHGIVAIDVLEEQLVTTFFREDVEFWQLDDSRTIQSRSLILQIYEDEIISRLKNDVSLYDRKTRNIRIPIRSAVLFCKNDKESLDAFPCLNDYSVEKLTLLEYIDFVSAPVEDACSEVELDKVVSLLEGTFIYQAKTVYSGDAEPKTFDDFIRLSLKTTFKQDDAQRAISMQLPNGPQRIRGLAGSGKTIVLSLKAAITHKRLNSFKILYLFNTQSLYNQVQTLITKYYSSEAKRAPNFEESIHVLHAWGGRARRGLYSDLCTRYGLMPLDFNAVKGRGDALKLIYGDLLKKIGDRIEPIYDLILIDEAQDFPEEVFEVIYKIAKSVDGKKRIVWAYDEFQSLKDAEIKEPAELFGKDANGNPNIPNEALEGEYIGGIQKDFVLPNCYRTPRPVLMTAHGVALGLYGKVTRMFYNPKDWEAIGYSVTEPNSLFLTAGEKITIERSDRNSKNILEKLLRQYEREPLDLIQCDEYGTWEDELIGLSNKIQKLIAEENVRPEEIVVINLLQGNNKSSMMDIQAALAQNKIYSVIPGYIESADIFKPEGCVTITTPFRAKGNEANIVFVVNSQVVSNDFTLRGRNSFFVAVTRSRGWCYISGYGDGIHELNTEIKAIRRDFPSFIFICPNEESVRSSRKLLSKTDRELNELQRMISTILGDEAMSASVLDALTKAKK
jgi:superfamily I DNA and RNA helicase